MQPAAKGKSLLSDNFFDQVGGYPCLRLALDAGFERAIVNKSPDECYGRYRHEPVIIVPRPDGLET